MSRIFTARCTSTARTFRCFGVSIRLRATTPAVLEAMIAALPPFATPAPAGTRPDLRIFLRLEGPCACGRHHNHSAIYNGSRLRASGTLNNLLDHCRQLAKFGVAERARRVFVHAGAVAWRGRIILIPGRSGAGKTTLVIALVRRGATYYSDEYAVVDAAGLVHPFPQDLDVRGTGSGRSRRIPAARLGWRPGVPPLPVGLVLIASFKRGARWRASSLSRARTVFEVLPHAVQHATQPARVIARLETALAQASNLQIVRGEADDAAGRVLAWLDRESDQTVDDRSPSCHHPPGIVQLDPPGRGRRERAKAEGTNRRGRVSPD